MISPMLVAFITTLVITIPVKFAADFFGTGRTSIIACLCATVVTGFFNAIALSFIDFGEFVTILISGITFMLVLKTTYLKGAAIAAIQVGFAYALMFWLFPLIFGQEIDFSSCFAA